MKIVVTIKQAPARDSYLRIDSAGAWIQEDDLSFEINEPDAYALEAGLQLREKNGGEVIALCAGPARASQTIREALAKGADRAIHIEDENLRAFDPLGVARLMAKAIEPEKPDLVLMDIQMPLMNGYDATRTIKADPDLRSIPIVAVSSFAMKGDEEKARAAGCDHYVTKPYSPMQLLKTIRSLLGE